MNKSLVVVLIIALVIVGLLLSPLLGLWALNTISEEAKFGWHIPHTFWTYISVWVLMILVRGGYSSSSK